MNETTVLQLTQIYGVKMEQTRVRAEKSPLISNVLFSLSCSIS